MKVIGVVISQKPEYGNFMLFAPTIGTTTNFGILLGSGDLEEMRGLALEIQNNTNAELKIFDRMRGVWIIPQPLLKTKSQEQTQTNKVQL